MINETRVERTPTPVGAAMPLSRRLRIMLGADWTVAWLLMLPTLILMGGLIAFPFIRATFVSFTNTTSLQIGPWVGLDNYRYLLKDSFFRSSLVITTQFTVASVVIKAIVGVISALLLNRLAGKASILVGLVLLPWIMPDVVRAITWKSLLDPLYGGVNRFLVDSGLISQAIPFLGDLRLALPSVIMVNLWQGIPFFTINILAGLKAIDQELYEAAAIDGASSWRQFLHITLPGLKYVLIVVTLLSTIWTFNTFTMIFLLTNGGPMNATAVYAIYSYRFLAGMRYGVAVAAALVAAPFLGVFIVVLGRYMMRGRTLYADTTEREPGIIMRALSLLFSPIGLALRGVVALFWVINDALESLVDAVRSAIRHAIGRKDDVTYVRHFPKWVGLAPAWIALIALLTFELLPFYWVIITAFKTELQITQWRNVFWPDPWTSTQFELLLGPRRNFLVWLRNTVTISVITPVISTVVAAAGAYALTRLRWKGAQFFSSAVLVAYLMPGIMMLIPIYQLLNALKLTNSLWSLIVSYPTFALPFAIWLMMGYYATIPEELEAAALVDGCNRIQAFIRVVLPLTRPALMAVMLFGITQAWSEFLFAYVMIDKNSQMTIPVGLSLMIRGDVLPWGELCAAAMIMSVPVLILYTIGQRFMVAGLTAGAVKGGG
jgi:multiple sugar transport system permease protein